VSLGARRTFEVREAERLEYEWLFRAAYPRIRRTVTSILRNPESAEDVTQEAFLKLLQHWRKVNALEQPDAWVRRVAIRLAVRHVKRETGRKSVATDTGPARSYEPDVDLDRAIAKLPPMQRAAVVMYYLDDQPVAEIARVLMVSDSTVKQHLFRARKRLASALGEEVAEDVH
jgi:RNA polymerase sigma-70 factor (ECF subfamily)